MLTDEQIEFGKAYVKYSLSNGGHHEHNDCIRMAYEWLDAQKKLKSPSTKVCALKHMIEDWAGRYVSRSDVDVAAFLHPEIHGTYPRFNISARHIQPDEGRLATIPEAVTQGYRCHDPGYDYFRHEDGGPPRLSSR